jgi:TIR domain
MNKRNKWEKPRAFILHDSRDKTSMAEPLANELKKLMCPVWYDQFSLRIGDSLRENIERGLKECSNCILILTPNFLSNEGWKREYDSIFTREIVEEQRVMLPVWDDVSIGDVSEFSPILADRPAVQWSMGLSDVARKLLQSIGV